MDKAKLKLIKAKVNSNKEHAFFYFLVMNLNLIEDKSVKTIAVDETGNVYYDPRFVNQFNESDLFNILTHEVMHLIMNHFEIKFENKTFANIAMDLAVNYILKENSICPPETFNIYDENGEPENVKGAVPDYNNEHTVMGYTIKRIDKKSSIEIYRELEDNVKQDESYNGLDEHKFDTKNNKRGRFDPKAKEKIEEMKRSWKNKTIQAETFAKMRGEFSEGVENIVSFILDKSLPWKVIFKKYLQRNLKSGNNWNKPNKRYRHQGVYYPSKFKENIEFVSAIDTSGSIGTEDFNCFVSNLLGMVNSHKNVKGRVLQWDTDVEKDFLINKDTTVKDFSSEGRSGYGGTSVSCLKPYLEKKSIKPKLLIILTDGFIEDITLKQLPDCKRLWVITKDGDENIPKKLGEEVIKIN